MGREKCNRCGEEAEVGQGGVLCCAGVLQLLHHVNSPVSPGYEELS